MNLVYIFKNLATFSLFEFDLYFLKFGIIRYNFFYSCKKYFKTSYCKYKFDAFNKVLSNHLFLTFKKLVTEYRIDVVLLNIYNRICLVHYITWYRTC